MSGFDRLDVEEADEVGQRRKREKTSAVSTKPAWFAEERRSARWPGIGGKRREGAWYPRTNFRSRWKSQEEDKKS
jgi:hypothetical protein